MEYMDYSKQQKVVIIDSLWIATVYSYVINRLWKNNGVTVWYSQCDLWALDIWNWLGIILFIFRKEAKL